MLCVLHNKNFLLGDWKMTDSKIHTFPISSCESMLMSVLLKLYPSLFSIYLPLSAIVPDSISDLLLLSHFSTIKNH